MARFISAAILESHVQTIHFPQYTILQVLKDRMLLFCPRFLTASQSVIGMSKTPSDKKASGSHIISFAHWFIAIFIISSFVIIVFINQVYPIFENNHPLPEKVSALLYLFLHNMHFCQSNKVLQDGFFPLRIAALILKKHSDNP